MTMLQECRSLLLAILLQNLGSEHIQKELVARTLLPLPPPPLLLFHALCCWRQLFKGARQETAKNNTWPLHFLSPVPHQYPISAHYCMAGSAAAFDYTALECGPRLKRFKSDLEDAIKCAIATHSLSLSRPSFFPSMLSGTFTSRIARRFQNS
jgi:hypothetical protein